MDFSKINAENKSTASLLDSLKKTSMGKSKKYGSSEDEWKIAKDPEGNGSARIRLIPSPDGELFVEERSHGKKNKKTGRWYIENCPKALDWDKGCPMCEHANSMKGDREWKNIPEDEQKRIKPFFATTSYWTNIVVEKDPANPDNEGKVFKYRFGKKILEKIVARLQDDEITDKPGISVFDLEDGAPFILKVRKVSGYYNYDNSYFDDPAPVKNGDEIVKSGVEIAWIRTDKNYKEYEELSKNFARTFGEANTNIPSSIEQEEKKMDSSADEDLPDTKEDDSGDEDGFDYFNNLVDQEV